MHEIKILQPQNFPPLLKQIPDPPTHIYMRGNIDPLFDPDVRILCVVGSRRYSDYGKEAVQKLIEGLRGYNICIVSGLALGIDSIAHRAALKAKLYTAAFPGSGLDESVLYPHSHKKLAQEIVESGGALLSEFEPTYPSLPHTFPQRNRLMAGVSHCTLVVEAELVSGTLITSRLAAEYDRDVGAVPGSIFSPLSAGPHMLIGKGAMSITCVDDLLEFLGFARQNGQSKLPLRENPRFLALGEFEKRIMGYLELGSKSRDEIIRHLNADPRVVGMALTNLELEGFIKEEGGVIRAT